MFSNDKNANKHLSSKEYLSGIPHKIKPVDIKIEIYFLVEIDINRDFLSF